MGQNTLGESDCSTFNSSVSLEQNDERDWFFACWYKFMRIKSWLKNVAMGMVKNECDFSGHRTLKLIFCMLIQIQEKWKLL